MTDVVLGLGSNRSFNKMIPPQILSRALELISRFIGNMKISSVYITKAMYVTDQSDFYNMAVYGTYDGSAFQLLEDIHKVENQLGRDRTKEIRFGPRSLDVDIELFGSQTINTPDLTVPHERIAERAFVLVPLLEILETINSESSKTVNSAVQNADVNFKDIYKNSEFYYKTYSAYREKIAGQGIEFFCRYDELSKHFSAGSKMADQMVIDSDLQETDERIKINYKFGNFDGPMDLIFSMIREKQINIFDIPIAEITDQFLDYLDYASQTNLQDLSEFYVWAAKLIHMKSRMLLPVEVAYDGDDDLEDPRQELVDTLIEYQRFKKLSILMEEQEEQSEWSFERKKIERTLPFSDDDMWEKMDTWALLQDMQKIFQNLTSVNQNERILDMDEEITVNEKIELMQELLDKKGECLFTELITRLGNELDVVCAFMAILEAVKFKMAEIYQNKMFGDIKICRKRAAA